MTAVIFHECSSECGKKQLHQTNHNFSQSKHTSSQAANGKRHLQFKAAAFVSHFSPIVSCIAAVLCAVHECIASIRALRSPLTMTIDALLLRRTSEHWHSNEEGWSDAVVVQWRNLQENVFFPANTRAALQEQPVKGPGLSFNSSFSL